MQVGAVYRVIAIACAAVWFALVLFTTPKFLNDNLLFISVSALTVGLMVLARLFLGLNLINSVVQTLQIIIMALVGLVSIYCHKYDKDFMKILVPIVLLSLIVFCITTTYGVITDPYSARIANSEWLEERFEGNEMVGLYGYVYMCVFIEPMLLYLMQKKVDLGKITNWLVRLTFIAILVMVACAGYMIAIFCTACGCVFVWTFSQKSVIKKVIVIFALILFLISYETIIDLTFSFLMELTKDNPVYYTKFYDFRSLLLSGDVSGDTVDGRFSNYAASFKNIVEYPFLGCYFFGKSGFGGGHSAILDIFGRFGLGTAIAYLYMLLGFPHRMSGKGRRWNALDYTVLIIAVIFGFLDPFFQEMSIAMFFMFPFVISAEREQSMSLKT